MSDEPQGPQDVTPPSTEASGQPVVIGFQDRKRKAATTPENPVPEHLQLPEKQLTVKLSKHQLRVRRAERRWQAYQLWLQDLPFLEIGRMLHVSKKVAHYYVKHYAMMIDQGREHGVQASRAKHVAQLALGKRTMMGLVTDTRVFAKDRVAAFAAYIQATNEQAKLNGEHMPVKVSSTTPDGERWAPLSAQLARLSTEDVAALLRLADVRLLPAGTVDAEVVDGTTGE